MIQSEGFRMIDEFEATFVTTPPDDDCECMLLLTEAACNWEGESKVVEFDGHKIQLACIDGRLETWL